MLVKPPLEALLPHVENRYTLAITVAKRTRQLVKGALPLATSETPNLVTLACEELAAGRIISVPYEVEPVVPLRPEVEAAMNVVRDLDEEIMQENASSEESQTIIAKPTRRKVRKKLQDETEESVENEEN